MSFRNGNNERKRGRAADLRSLLGKLSLRSKLGACPPLSREWQQRLERVEDATTLAAIRRSTSRGRPLVGDSFLSKLEHTLGKRLRALPVGRPRKEPK